MPLDDLMLIKPEYLTPYLEFVKENSRVFRAVAFQPTVFQTNTIFNKMYDEILNPILSRFNMTEEDKKYSLAFYLNGSYAVVQEWIKGGCVEDINYIVELLNKCINKSP